MPKASRTAMTAPFSKEQMTKIGEHYEAYDFPYRLDPFKKIHWGTVAEWVKKTKAGVYHAVDARGNLLWGAVTKPVVSRRDVNDFTTNSVGKTAIGETECTAFCYREGYESEVIRQLLPFVEGGLWLNRVNQENRKNDVVLNGLGARFLSARIAGVGSEMYGIYYAGRRSFPGLPAHDQVCFGRYSVRLEGPDEIVKELLGDGQDFKVTDRGTRYGGPDMTWTRVVIRGAGDDPDTAECQLEGHLRGSPRLLKFLRGLTPFENIDAVMLTRVRGDGLIARHTDNALDRDVGSVRGFNKGMTLRTHFVLQADPECAFNIWDLDGTMKTVKMKAGEVWYTDVRRTHSVENPGPVDRIHLVVDIRGIGTALLGKLDKTI